MKVPVATVALSPEALGWAEALATQRRREARPPALLLPGPLKGTRLAGSTLVCLGQTLHVSCRKRQAGE